jgi:hypothetical protein
MAPTDEFAFEGNHHCVKIRLWGEVEANLNSEVWSSFAGGDPLGAFIPSPFSSSFLLAGPYGSGLVPIYFRSGCAAKGLEDLLRLVHVGRGAL